MRSFRTVRNTDKFTRIATFLRNDAIENGGTASEIIDTWGSLRLLTASKVPWGSILINEELTYLEALAWWLKPLE